MRVMILGGGGREHALAWKLRQSPRVERVFALPGSDAIAACATCLSGDACDPAAVVAAVRAHGIDLTVAGPEAPLAAGVGDAVRGAGYSFFGPSRAAAQLEASKIFAKLFMQRHRIPTARFEIADDLTAARRALAGFNYPVVVKADGLAAGKGVIIAVNEAEAASTLEAMLAGELVGAAGRRVLIEECLRGPELSLLAVCDGARWQLLPAARDHKRLRDHDQGPNTGGMGAYSVDALLPTPLREEIERTVIAPTLAGMAAEGTPFQGVLYCGLMLTAAGPRVLEYNVRLGDPEAQPILLRWRGDLAECLLTAAQGNLPAAEDPAHARLHAPAAACVVAAAEGYPAQPRRGDAITGLEAAARDPQAVVFHAGTRRRPGTEEVWETNGGRVLGVAASAPDLERALAACYRVLGQIHFRGMQYRRDIGVRRAEAHPPRE